MDFEIQASAQGSVAKTTNLGTAESPKTLLAGLTDSYSGVPDPPVPSAHISLSAFDNSCPEDVEWSKSGPTWGFWLDGQQTGNTVVYDALEPGKYTFTADCGCKTKSIDVYVVRTDITNGPEYIFSHAYGRIPFEFGLEGTGSANFYIDDSSNFNTESWYIHEAIWGEGEPEVDTWEWLAFHPLGTFGPTWDSASDENGQHSSYKVVTDSENPYFGTELEGPGKTENLFININCRAKLVLSDQETNFALIKGPYTTKILPPDPLYKIDDWQVRFLDRKWPVINIGSTTTFYNAFACIKGTGRFHHVRDDSFAPDDGCSGYNLYTSEADTFYHGGNDWYTDFESERHYHTEGLIGFDDYIAGMTSPMSTTGLKVEARLFDDTDGISPRFYGYLARALDSGIDTHVFISYKLANTTRFVNFWDLDSLDGKLRPLILPNIKLRHFCKAGSSKASEYLGVGFATTGFVLAVVANLEFLPAWVVIGTTKGGLLLSTIGLLEAIKGTGSFSEVQFHVAGYGGLADWDSDIPTGTRWEWSGASTGNGWSINKPFGANGFWHDSWTYGGINVTVGQQLRSSIVFYLTAQEACDAIFEAESHGILTLERDDGHTHDLRQIRYEWE